MGKQSAPQPPNLQPISDAQVQIAAENQKTAQQYLGLSQQQFEFMKTNAAQEMTFAKSQADRSFGLQQSALDTQNQIAAAATKVSDQQQATMAEAQKWAEQDRARYQSQYQPVQDQMLKYAQDYASQARQDTNASQALADTNSQFAQAQANARQHLQGLGVDPSQVESSSMLNQMGVQNAGNAAMNANNARIQTQMQGQSLLGNAANMGAGLPASTSAYMTGGTNAGAGAIGAASAGQQGQLNAMGQSINYGGSGLSALTNSLSAYGNATGTPMQYAGLSNNLSNSAMSGYSSAANTQMNQFSAGLQASNANNATTSGEISNVMGIASMAMMAGGGAVPMAAAGPVQPNNDMPAIDPTMPQMALDMSSAPQVSVNDLHQDPQGIKNVDAVSFRDIMKGRLANAATVSNSIHAPKYDTGTGAPTIYAPVQMPGPTDINAASGGMPIPPNGRPQPRTGMAVPMNQSVDKVHAMLTPGEYVIPADVVHSKGLEFFDNIVKKYHRPGA